MENPHGTCKDCKHHSSYHYDSGLELCKIPGCPCKRFDRDTSNDCKGCNHEISTHYGGHGICMTNRCVCSKVVDMDVKLKVVEKGQFILWIDNKVEHKSVSIEDIRDVSKYISGRILDPGSRIEVSYTRSWKRSFITTIPLDFTMIIDPANDELIYDFLNKMIGDVDAQSN